MYKGRDSNSRLRCSSGLFVWCTMLVLLTAVAAGDVGEGQIETDYEQESKQMDVSAVGEQINAAGEKVIQSITFKKNMGIREALMFLSLKYNRNIVPSSEVDGQLAFTSLFNVTFDEAMQAILGGKFEYGQSGNLIEVYTRGDQNRMKYKVFGLRYISAAEAKKLIQPVLSGSGQVGTTSAAETGVPTGESISSPKGGGDTMSLRDTIVVYDYSENIAKAEQVINAIDVRPQQVLVEATILSAKLNEDMQFGIDWQSLKGTAISALAGINRNTADYFTSAGIDQQVTKSGGMTIGLAIDDVGAFIRAVEEITDVTILANPKILAVNKQLGQVYIGSKVGYRDGDTFDEQGNRVEGEVKFLDTGTKLSFRPYINENGYIRMDIHSKDSTDATGTDDIPSEISAELVSNVMVRDGQTVVIGGLFRDKLTSKKTQIPLLGDLPIVGMVFKGTADTVERHEVMVLLTPHIIEEPIQANGEARIEDVRLRKFAADSKLQWTGRYRLAENYYADAVENYIDGDDETAMRQLNRALRVHPSHLSSMRLKEKIIGQTDPNAAAKIERIMLRDIEKEDSEKWMRR